MTLLTMILRGIRYRPGRSVAVLALATIATAAAVMTPAYTSAAHQSLLTDTLTDIPTGQDGARFAATEPDTEAEAEYFTTIFDAIDDKVSGSQGLSPLRDPVEYASAQVMVAGAAQDQTVAEVLYRDGLCGKITMVAGDCETRGGEVLVSKRSAQFEKLSVGDTLQLGSGPEDTDDPYEADVAGIYEPNDPSAGYWGATSPFSNSTPADGANQLDALLVTKATATVTNERSVEIGVEYALDVTKVRLSNADLLGAELAALDGTSVGVLDMTVASRFTETMKDIDSEQDSVSASVPTVTIPLLLLAWFVLYLVVARLSEERAPQIALAKLRGHRFSTVTGFGTGEAAVLIVAGAPLGVLLGWAIVDVLARASLMDGVSVSFTADMVAYAGVALLGAWAAALVAARHVLTLPVLVLLRRVPARRRWRTGLAEGALVAVAAVAVWQVLSVSDAGAIGLLVTPFVALVVGVVVARLLELWARWRLPAALRKGRLARMLALAQVARRTETRRMVVLVTVASAVMTFGVCAWDISDHNRQLAASDEIGADRVYTLSGGDPEDVMDTVDKLDPEGSSLMAVMRRFDRYESQNFTTLAVQSDRLAEVAKWRDMAPEQLNELAGDLHPKHPDPLRIKGAFTISATVDKAEAKHKLAMVARVVDDAGEPATLRLGKLSKGTGTYSSKSQECENGCRLIGLGVSRHPGDFDEVTAQVHIHNLSDANGQVNARFDDCSAWRPGSGLPAEVPLDLGCSEKLSISVTSNAAQDVIAEYASTPSALPVAVAGRIPADEVTEGRFRTMGPQGELQQYRRDQSVSIVPRGGIRAMVVDLDYANQAAQNFTALGDREDLRFEIWANESAGSGVAEDIVDAGFDVTKVESRDKVVQQLSRAAPALSLRLYMLASGLALLLVLGAIVLTSTVGAAVRGYDTAALGVAGVKPRALRKASRREYLYWIVVPALAGIGAGLGGLALVLPNIPLVSNEPAAIAADYSLRPLWPSLAFALVAFALAGVVLLAVHIGRIRGKPERLRDSEG